jgi:hypothetical protein
MAHLRECEGSKFLHKKEIGINAKENYNFLNFTFTYNN